YQDRSTMEPIIAMLQAVIGIMMSSRWVNTPELHQLLLIFMQLWCCSFENLVDRSSRVWWHVLGLN
ncbi:hypothetical protein ACJX0J_008202, partial [Zea mays]